MAMHFLKEDADFMGDGPAEQARKVNYVSYAQRRGRGVKRWDGLR